MLTEARIHAVGGEQVSPEIDSARGLTELSDAGRRGRPLSSASKTLALLAALGTRGRSFGVTEVAMDIGVPESTAHRLLKTLEEYRFVARTGSRYRAGARLFELSEVARWCEYGELRDAAYRPLIWLFERSAAIAVHLAVLRGQDVMYLDKITCPEGTRLPSRIGGRFPPHVPLWGRPSWPSPPSSSRCSEYRLYAPRRSRSRRARSSWSNWIKPGPPVSLSSARRHVTGPPAWQNRTSATRRRSRRSRSPCQPSAAGSARPRT
jgi:hypothetical protein